MSETNDYSRDQRPKKSKLAIASLIIPILLWIISIYICEQKFNSLFLYMIFLSPIIGITLAIWSMILIYTSKGKIRGKGFTILGIIISLILFAFYPEFLWAIEIPLHKIGSSLKLYISQNNGDFPSGKEDLIAKGYLTLQSQPGGEDYYSVKGIEGFYFDWGTIDMSSEYPVAYYNNAYLGRYNIKFGSKAEDLKVIHGKLVDVKTNSPILLIDGPLHFALKKQYEMISLDLYKEMLFRKNNLNPKADIKGKKNDIADQNSSNDKLR